MNEINSILNVCLGYYCHCNGVSETDLYEYGDDKRDREKDKVTSHLILFSLPIIPVDD